LTVATGKQTQQQGALAVAKTQYGRFLKQMLRHPSSVGAVAPSSKYLTAAMLDWIDWAGSRNFVEYGPGTGVFTAAILERMQPGSKLIAIELNKSFAEELQQEFSDVRVKNGNVAHVERLCREEGIEKVDAIISSLPWAIFPRAKQHELLTATEAVIKPGGQFCTYRYIQGQVIPARREFKHHLAQHFASVELSPIVWLNIPPAFVYRCVH